MHECGLITGISVVLAAAGLCSCSIKQDRTECPCYLDIALARQAGETFGENKAWCGVWDGQTRILEEIFSPVTGRDSSISRPVPRGRTATVVISNFSQEGNCIAVEAGSQMKRLYVSRQDVECKGDHAGVGFDSFCKQYVSVTFHLNGQAYPYRDSLSLSFEGPYDGLALPSMKPHAGIFRHTAGFDDKGQVTVLFPPQGGPGLKAAIRLGTNPPAEMDLYRTMLDAGYDWKCGSLADFEATLGLNSVSGIAEVVDWNVVRLDDRKY